jgi:hypothetical protein
MSLSPTPKSERETEIGARDRPKRAEGRRGRYMVGDRGSGGLLRDQSQPQWLLRRAHGSRWVACVSASVCQWRPMGREKMETRGKGFEGEGILKFWGKIGVIIFEILGILKL